MITGAPLQFVLLNVGTNALAAVMPAASAHWKAADPVPLVNAGAILSLTLSVVTNGVPKHPNGAGPTGVIVTVIGLTPAMFAQVSPRFVFTPFGPNATFVAVNKLAAFAPITVMLYTLPGTRFGLVTLYTTVVPGQTSPFASTAVVSVADAVGTG